MRIVVVQPPYTEEGTVQSAEECLQWIKGKLNALSTGAHDLVLLPEYVNAPGLGDHESLRTFVGQQGTEFLAFLGASVDRLGSIIVASAAVHDRSR